MQRHTILLMYQNRVVQVLKGTKLNVFFMDSHINGKTYKYQAILKLAFSDLKNNGNYYYFFK